MRAIVGLILLLVLGACTGVFYQPLSVHVRTPDDIGLQYEDVYVTSSDGVRLHAWWLPAKKPAAGTVLFLHGNAENISTHIGSVYWLPAQGFNVLLLDYRGYGESQGKPTPMGVQIDVKSTLRFLVEQRRENRLVVFAQSLGGAIAIPAVAQSAYRAHIAAVIVESTFSSYRLIAREKLGGFWPTWPLQYPLSWTVSDAYSPLKFIARISPIPLLIIHSKQDEVIPVTHAPVLFAAAQEPKQLWIIENAKHIQAFNNPEWRARLVAYLQEVLKE
jgi:uncharacterized protein